MSKSSGGFGVTSPGETMVAFAATEGAQVEVVVLMEGGALGSSASAANVPVDAKNLVSGSVHRSSLLD